VTATFSWENSNMLNASHVLVFDENYKIVRSNKMALSQPGRVEELFNRLFGHWGAGDFEAIKPYWHPTCVQTVHNMKDGSTVSYNGSEECHRVMVEDSAKMTDVSDFEVVNMTFNEATRQAFTVMKCPASGVNFSSAIYTYNEDYVAVSLHIVMDRDW